MVHDGGCSHLANIAACACRGGAPEAILHTSLLYHQTHSTRESKELEWFYMACDALGVLPTSGGRVQTGSG